MRTFLSILAIAAIAACGQPAATTAEAQAQTGAAAENASGEVSAAERAAILATLSLSANAQGAVMNECGELSTPQFLPADLGAGVGRAVVFAMGGGPNTAACYGDGPDVHLMRHNGGTWREIYGNRGGSMIVLSTTHNGANDLADGGPGFSFPVWEWNGTEYANANRQVPDSALNDARFLP